MDDDLRKMTVIQAFSNVFGIPKEKQALFIVEGLSLKQMYMLAIYAVFDFQDDIIKKHVDKRTDSDSLKIELIKEFMTGAAIENSNVQFEMVNENIASINENVVRCFGRLEKMFNEASNVQFSAVETQLRMGFSDIMNSQDIIVKKLDDRQTKEELKKPWIYPFHEKINWNRLNRVVKTQSREVLDIVNRGINEGLAPSLLLNYVEDGFDVEKLDLAVTLLINYKNETKDNKVKGEK